MRYAGREKNSIGVFASELASVFEREGVVGWIGDMRNASPAPSQSLAVIIGV